MPQYEEAPVGFGSLFRHNVRLAGGPAPVRAYIEELMPDILEGAIKPGKVFDATTGLDGVPAGYQDMADRNSLKVMIVVTGRPPRRGLAGVSMMGVSRARGPLLRRSRRSGRWTP